MSLQFDPQVGSIELANALAFKYPLEPDLESQIRRALVDYWTSEYTSSTSGQLLQPSPTTTSVETKILTSRWEITTGDPSDRKRKRARYNDAKGKKVAEVRKHGACAFHRKRKSKVSLRISQIN